MFTLCVASKSAFSYEFSHEPLNLLPQNRCFVRDFRQFSSHLTKCYACHEICALPPPDSALTIRFAKNTQHDTSEALRLPCKMAMDTSKVRRLPRKLPLILRKRRKSIAHATQQLSTRYETRLNVTKCHACHTKRSHATLEISKSDPFAELTIGAAIRPSGERLRTVADG